MARSDKGSKEEMKEFEVTYVRHGEEAPEGFERTGALEGTHHGEFADIAVKVIERCPFCGNEDCKPVDFGTHVEMSMCKQVKDGCCG